MKKVAASSESGRSAISPGGQGLYAHPNAPVDQAGTRRLPHQSLEQVDPAAAEVGARGGVDCLLRPLTAFETAPAAVRRLRGLGPDSVGSQHARSR